MVVTKTTLFSKGKMRNWRKGIYINTVIDVKKKLCSAGCEMHADSEKILLEGVSGQSNIWGGGIGLDMKIIDFSSFINSRPGDNNSRNEIQDTNTGEEYEK